jgi:uncharacterized delta-60 repeat protein
VTARSHGRLVVSTLAAAVLVAGSSQAAFAGKQGAGNLDGKFGSHGKVLTTIAAPAAAPTPGDSAGPETFVLSLGQQPSGKLIAMGFHNELGSQYYALARYSDGVLDTSFGAGGKVVFSPGAGTPAGMAIQSDGKIIVAGSLDLSTSGCQADFMALRLDVNGAVDASFGTNGQVVTDFGGCDAANAVTVGQDDSIVLVGFTGGGGDVAVARYSADGTPDPGFGSGGKATSAGLGSGQSVVIQPDGDIVVGANNIGDFGLVGFTSSGAIDLTFGSGGSTSTFFGPVDFAVLASIALRSNGGIVAVGGNYDGTKYNIAIAAYDASGNLDPAFGSGGTVQTDLTGAGGEDQAGGVAIQPDGKIVVSGWSCLANCDFAVARYLGSTGALDSSFGHGGHVTTDFQSGSGDLARPVLIQADGKIVVGGYSNALGTGAFALARYKA